MGNLSFLLGYMQLCMGGRLAASECGGVWQLLVIIGLIVVMAVILAVLRLRSRSQPSNA